MAAQSEGSVERKIVDPDFKPHDPRPENPEMCRCGATKYDPACYCQSDAGRWRDG